MDGETELDLQLTTIEREGGRLAAAVRRDPAAPLRSCPDWTAGDLLAHVDSFARWVHGLVVGDAELDRDLPTIERAEADATWDADLARLVATLGETPPDAPARNWAVAPDTVAFWQRRAANELTVHRWDAETGHGATPEPVAGAVAADGVDEFFEVFVATGLQAGMVPRSATTLVVELADHGTRSEHHLPEPGPVTTIRGDSPDVLLALWGRRPLTDLHVDGDPTPLRNWPTI